MRRVSLLWLCVMLAACEGPDATALVGQGGVDADDFESSGGELTSSSRAARWWPMDEGNTWVFESAKQQRTVRMRQVGGGMAVLSGVFPDDIWVGVGAAANTLLAWDFEQRAWVPFLRFGYARTRWTYGEGPCTGLTLKRAATGVVVATPAGSFSDTRVISAEQRPDPLAFCKPPAFSELTFAAGVGLVAFRTGMGERFVLSSALVHGRAVPGGVSSTLTLDRAEYQSLPNTIRCITTPCPGNAQTALASLTFTLTNTSSEAVGWTFSSGCQFDLELLTPGGEVVRRLSKGQLCTQALTRVDLQPGESKAFTADLPLEDSTGLQLDGNFVARAVLRNRDGSPVPSPTAPFTVHVVQ